MGILNERPFSTLLRKHLDIQSPNVKNSQAMIAKSVFQFFDWWVNKHEPEAEGSPASAPAEMIRMHRQSQNSVL